MRQKNFQRQIKSVKEKKIGKYHETCRSVVAVSSLLTSNRRG